MHSAAQNPMMAESEKEGSIIDDFMYGNSVAAAHLYVRLGFLRKVYGILSLQLLVTTIIGGIFVASESLQAIVKQNQWMLFIAMLGTFVMLIALAFKSKETPTNYILLGLFTLFESYLIGVVVAFHDVHIVVAAFVLTLSVTLALTIYTLQSKRDFSSWGAALFAGLWILIMAGFLQMFLHSRWTEFLLSAGGALLFCLFIIYDTHMVMAKVSPEEYIHAAICIYLDVINLFLYILRLLSEMNKK